MADISQATTPRASWRRRWSKRLAITFGAMALLSVAFLGVAEHQTAKPEFCGSCHVMEPYHESWMADLHGGKLDVACVDCHYAPGERTTVNAKLRGLSQVASYFSGRYGATRPRAHVSNDSCTTAKCHGDQQFMDKVIEIGTVRFTHAKHLKLDESSRDSAQKDLTALSATIRAAVGDERFTQLEQVANEAGPHQDRIDKLFALASASSAQLNRDDLERYSQLHHRRIRVEQLADIQCTNCHAYGSHPTERDISNPDKTKPAHHFTVSTTSCYTCHFNNEGFNTGTNTCLMCHKQLPEGEIIVHKELTAEVGQKLQSPELSTQTVKMDHRTILERKVNCVACHADVAREDSLVTRRDCERCHDQPRFFEKWQEPFTLDLVAHYHKVHVPGQRAKCLDCHSEIHHQLIPDNGGGDGKFLASVMADCMRCHPNHHREQLNLLRGIGSLGVEKSTPNLMFGSRTNCLGCHTEMASHEHVGDVSKAGLSGCLACHGDRHAQTFEKWKLGLELVQTDADQAYASAQKALDEAKDIPDEIRKKASELLAACKSDLMMVKRGNGLHNVTYAMEIFDSVTQRAQQALSIVAEAKPAEPKDKPNATK